MSKATVPSASGRRPMSPERAKRQRREKHTPGAQGPFEEGRTALLVLGNEATPVFSRASTARTYAHDPSAAPTELNNPLHRTIDLSGFHAQERADVATRVGQTQSKATRIIRLLRQTEISDSPLPSRPRFIQHGTHACAECRLGDWVCVSETRVRCLSCGHKPCSGSLAQGALPSPDGDVTLPTPALTDDGSDGHAVESKPLSENGDDASDGLESNEIQSTKPHEVEDVWKETLATLMAAHLEHHRTLATSSKPDQAAAHAPFVFTNRLLGGIVLNDEKTARLTEAFHGVTGHISTDAGEMLRAMHLFCVLKTKHFTAEGSLDKGRERLWADFHAFVDRTHAARYRVLESRIAEMAQLKADMARLKADNTTLSQENKRVVVENQGLSEENHRLDAENSELRRRLAQLNVAQNATTTETKTNSSLEAHQVQSETGETTASAEAEISTLKAQIRCLTAENERLASDNTAFATTKQDLVRVVSKDIKDAGDVLDTLLDAATDTHITNHRLRAANADLVRKLHHLSKVDLPAALRENERLEAALCQARNYRVPSPSEVNTPEEDDDRTHDGYAANAKDRETNCDITRGVVAQKPNCTLCSQHKEELTTLHRRLRMIETAPLLDETVRALKKENQELWTKLFTKEQKRHVAILQGLEIADAILAKGA